MVTDILVTGLLLGCILFCWFFSVVEKSRTATEQRHAEEVNDIHLRYQSMYDDGWEDCLKDLIHDYNREILRKYNEGWNTAITRYLTEEDAVSEYRPPNAPIPEE